jgi:uncharacterized membrane protein YedE/YeeE
LWFGAPSRIFAEWFVCPDFLMTVVDTLAARPAGGGPLDRNRLAALLSAALLGLGALWIGDTISGKQAALFLVGGALGVVLYHAAFGFTSAYRVLIADGRGAGLRAQMAMLALAAILFFPAVADGSLFGHSVAPNIHPIGVGLVAGAFLFGVGMQLGSGCASGTLYTVGGGSTRMVVTLAFFILGSTVGSAHFDWWEALPKFAPVDTIKLFGWPVALAGHLAAFALIAGGTIVIERRIHGRLTAEPRSPRQGLARLLRGPWPLIWGAFGLAVLNFVTLAIAGKPWGITSAFALWGSQLADAIGIDVASWSYWQAPKRAAELHQSLFRDITSVMDLGIILGAMVAAGLAGRFAPTWRIPARSLMAAILGGTLMGYGARLAYGCNIGSYFSGIASGSLHGWIWIIAALVGSALGTWIRPAFGLAVERTARRGNAC